MADLCKLQLRVPSLIRPLQIYVNGLSVTTADESSGDFTGSYLWTGGRVLAAWLGSLQPETADRLLRNRAVLELACGKAALPARIAARYGASPCCASDGSSAVIDVLRGQLQDEDEEKSMDIVVKGFDAQDHASQWDVVLFADAVYSKEKARLLARCCAMCSAREINSKLSPPCVIGCVSGNRLGPPELMRAMREEGFVAEEMTMTQKARKEADTLWDTANSEQLRHILVGGPASEFYVVRWIRANVEDVQGKRLEDDLANWQPPAYRDGSHALNQSQSLISCSWCFVGAQHVASWLCRS